MDNNLSLKDLCIVVLENPYKNLSILEARTVFSNILDVKLRGYVAIYDEGVMPIDTTDFIATHLMIADKNNPFEKIYLTYKSISYKTCEKYNVPFPFMAILKNNAHPSCYNEMERILNECKHKDQDLSYEAGWTIDPLVRENKKLQNELKEVMTMFAINHHAEYNIPHWVTLGICKVKTDQFFIQMGLKEISAHSVLSHPYLHQTDARAIISQNGQYNDHVYEIAKKYQNLWENRITINMSSVFNKNRIKVAA